MTNELLEKELKKRWNYDYSWGTKQTNAFDVQTNFIYTTKEFDHLLVHIDKLFKKHPQYINLKNYTLNRWYNFWSAKAVEDFFCEHTKVTPHPNSKDKFTDFYIENIPFDHKTTVFPKGFGKSIPYAIQHKTELIQWLYQNQSKEQRQHFKNRLFIVLINGENYEVHWKLKAEIMWLKKIISTYLSKFDSAKLQTFTFENKTVYADIIWAIR
jgi:hypothetical protein